MVACCPLFVEYWDRYENKESSRDESVEMQANRLSSYSAIRLVSTLACKASVGSIDKYKAPSFKIVKNIVNIKKIQHNQKKCRDHFLLNAVDSSYLGHDGPRYVARFLRRAYSSHSKNRVSLHIAPISLVKSRKKSLLCLCVPGTFLVRENVNNKVCYHILISARMTRICPKNAPLVWIERQFKIPQVVFILIRQ